MVGKLSLVLSLACLLSFGSASAQAGDVIFVAVKAPANFTIGFALNGGTDAHSTPLWNTQGNGVTKRTSDGFYMEKLPPGVDVSKATKFCAEVFGPAKYAERFVCTKRAKLTIPADGVLRLELKL